MPNQTAPSSATAMPLSPAFSSATAKVDELAVLEAADAVAAELDEPDRAVGCDRDVGGHRPRPRQVESLEAAVRSDAQQLVARLKGRPDGAVGGYRDPVGAAEYRLERVAG